VSQPRETIARKLVILSGGPKGAAFSLTESSIGLGRDDDNPICLDGEFVSRHHAVLVRDNGEYLLRDLNSSNGTLLNGHRAKNATLRHGDHIRIGEVEMLYEIDTHADELADLRRQYSGAQQQLAETQKQAAERATELDSTRKTLTAAEERAASRVKELTQRNDSLTAELATARKQADDQRTATERVAEKLAKIRTEAQTAAKNDQRRITQLTQVGDRLAAEVRATSEALVKASAELDAIPTLRREIEELSRQGKELVAQLSSEKQQTDALCQARDRQAGELQRTKEKLAHATDEVMRLEQSTSEGQENLTKAAEENRRVNAELVDVREQLAATERHAADQIASLRTEHKRALRVAEELPELKNLSTGLAKQNSDLLAKISALQEHEVEIVRLEAELDTARAAIEYTSQELSARLEAIDSELRRRGRIASMEQMEAELARAATLLADLNNLQMQIVDRVTRQNAALHLALAKAQEELVHARRRLAAQTTEEFSRLRRDMTAKAVDNSSVPAGLLRQLSFMRRSLRMF
jgi:chromosome segregation ATPase